MNTKVLSCLVAGLLSAVTLAAEEYRVTIPGNNVLSPIANHLNHSPDNTLSSLFPNVPIGTRVWKWVCNLGYVSSRRGASGAWIPSFTLAPGEGALIQFPGPDLTITFTGDRVPFTPPPLSCNCDAVYFLGAQTPDIGTWETIVGAKPPEGALLMRYAVPTQSWATNLFTNCKWSDGVPFANVGEAVLLYIPCGTNDCPCPDEAIGLFNTGVDTNRQVLTWGTDPHYQVSDGSNAPQQAVIITDPPYDWVTNGNNSGWIGVDTNGWGGSNVVYTYRTTFWLPCTNEVIITGRWAVADSGVMTLNSGSPPAATLSGSDAASAWHGFGINRGFVKGWNTLEFQVSSAQGRTGLRVELGGTAQCCNCKAPVCVTIEDGTFATFLGEAGCATETTTGVTLTEDSPGPSGLATDHFLRMQDQYGVSVAYSDAVAGDWLCTNNCLTLYYDFRIFDDGDPTAHLAIQPTITIVSHPDCNQPRLRAEWIPNAPVTEDTGTNGGWHTIAAPLLPACNGQPPPSPHGQWLMLDGASPSRWLELLGHVTAIELHGDYTGPNLERVGWDNFCVLTNCECRLNITCFSNRLVECQSSWDFDTPVAADGCCGIANLTYQDTSGWVAGSPCLHWFTRTWTATDGAGHQVSCSQTITEQDTTAPTINCSGLQALPITVTNACKGYVPDFCISNYFSDNCCPAFCLRQDPLANTVLGAGIHPVVLTVSDSAGNLALCTIYFTVIAPTQQRAWNSGMSGENAAPWRVIQTPAGTTDIPAILTAVPTGWLPNDAASSWVSYLDNTFTSPAGWFIYRLTFNLTCTNDAAIAGRFAVDNAAWIYLNGLYTGADAPNPGYGAWHPVSITHGFQLGANTLDICVTNGGGWTGIRAELTNTYTCCCTNAISVKCPSNLLACVCGTITHAYVDFTGTATNHCTNTVVSVISTPPPGWFPIGNTWVTTVARDELGNEASCSFLVTVIKDTAPPSLTVPANIVRYTCDNRVQVYYKATATDNCDKEVAITYDPPSGSWFDSGTTRLVTARAVDDCGLVTTRTFTVQVISKLYWQEYPAGKDDCFQAPPEDPYRVGCFTTAFPGVTWSKFDCTQRNRHFGYSWRNLLGGNVEGEVALEMKPLGSAFALNPNSRNDAIGFDTHLCPASSFLWDNQIESLPGTGTWRPMSQPNKCGRKFTLQLQNMPLGGDDLLSGLNTSRRLHLLVRDDTSVDWAKLRLLRCPPASIINGGALELTNAVEVWHPTGRELIADPANASVTNFQGRFSLGNPRGGGLLIDPVTLPGLTNPPTDRTVRLEFEGDEEEGAPAVAFGFAATVAGSGLEWRALAPSNAVNVRLHLLSGGVEVAVCDPAQPVTQAAVGTLVGVLFTGATNATARFPVPVQLAPRPSDPPVSADAIRLEFDGPVPAQLAASRLKLTAENLPSILVRGLAWDAQGFATLLDGDAAEDIYPHPIWEMLEGVVSVSSLDVDSLEPLVGVLHTAPTSEFRAQLGLPFGVFEPPPTNASLTLITRGRAAGSDRDLPAVRGDLTATGWNLTLRAGAAPTNIALLQVLYDGAVMTNLANVSAVEVSELPAVHWPVLGGSPGTTLTHRLLFTQPVLATIGGVSHPCSELRLQTALSTPVEALTGERVEALHASALALPPLAAGPEQYHLAPPELDGDGLNLRWAGLGGVLEGEPSIGAPWQPVPGAVGGAVTVPVTNAPMMLFRVRAQ